MIVDSSALIAIARNEPDSDTYASALRTAGRPRRIAAPTLVEAAVVADGYGPLTSRLFDELVRAAGLDVVAFDEPMAQVARAAYRDFGKGNGHPARLNLGDCFSYALAAITGEPLLYKGNDFAHTGIRSALG